MKPIQNVTSFAPTRKTEGLATSRNRLAPLADTDSEQLFPAETLHSEEEVVSHSGVDDALGLYLKQMGSIPLLTREKGIGAGPAFGEHAQPVSPLGAV